VTGWEEYSAQTAPYSTIAAHATHKRTIQDAREGRKIPYRYSLPLKILRRDPIEDTGFCMGRSCAAVESWPTNNRKREEKRRGGGESDRL
jgi:hypothetical protein